MAAVWLVREAKNRFSEVIEKALNEGPQVAARHGRPVVKVVAFDEVETGAVAKRRWLYRVFDVDTQGRREGPETACPRPVAQSRGARDLIGATATVRSLQVATRNTRHFKDLGVPLFNPWQPAN